MHPRSSDLYLGRASHSKLKDSGARFIKKKTKKIELSILQSNFRTRELIKVQAWPASASTPSDSGTDSDLRAAEPPGARGLDFGIGVTQALHPFEVEFRASKLINFKSSSSFEPRN